MQGRMKIWITITLAVATTYAHAEQYPFDSDAWNIDGEDAEVVDYLGRTSLRLKGAAAAWFMKLKFAVIGNSFLSACQSICAPNFGLRARCFRTRIYVPILPCRSRHGRIKYTIAVCGR